MMAKMRSDPLIQAALDEALLDMEELCRAAAVSPEWLLQRVDAGLVPAPGAPGEPQRWRFDATSVRRVRCMVRIERDFEAGAALAALVADLQDEIERLRARLRRGGLA